MSTDRKRSHAELEKDEEIKKRFLKNTLERMKMKQYT
jgi:hypothetical protein